MASIFRQEYTIEGKDGKRVRLCQARPLNGRSTTKPGTNSPSYFLSLFVTKYISEIRAIRDKNSLLT